MKREFTYKGKPYSFRQVVVNFQRVKQQLPAVLGTIAVNYFTDSFRRQGWRDFNIVPWAKRKASAKNNRGRAILVRSARLRNSIRLQQATWARTTVATSVPYATAHNEGYTGTVQVRGHKRHIYTKHKEAYTTRKGTTRNRTARKAAGEYDVKAHSRKMSLPQRQFMGDSEVMNRKFDVAVTRAVDKIFDL